MKTKFLLFILCLTFSNAFSQLNNKEQIETKFRILLEDEFDGNTIKKGEIIISKETYQLMNSSFEMVQKDIWLCVFDDGNGLYYQLALEYYTNQILYSGYQIDYKGAIPAYKGLKNINFGLLLKKFKETVEEIPTQIRIVKKELNYLALGITKDHYIKLQNDNFKMYLDLYTYERL